MPALPPDYDTDPERWASHDESWLVDGDIHEEVARRIAAHGLRPTLDVGSGHGRLRTVLPQGWPWIGVDSSPTQLRADRGGLSVLGDAARLPFPDGSFGAVAALWMLYHLDDPTVAVREARRVLRRGGVFFACTNARTNDPELTDGYPATPFDAEEAPELVASVFGASAIEVVTWDAPLVRLPDREAVVRYLRSHFLPAHTAERVRPPLTLTKRSCLILGFRHD